MIKLIIDLIGLIGGLIIISVCLFGWGQICWRVLGMKTAQNLESASVWLGFCLIIGLTEIAHLFIPINWKVSLVFLLIGLFGCMLTPQVFSRLNVVAFRHYCSNHRWWFLYTILITLGISFRAMTIPNNYDSGLYHFQSIRWLNEYPIVLGLGNLHWRLALNQSYFGFLGLLNVFPFWGKGYAVGGAFIWLLVFATVLEYCVQGEKKTRWITFITLGVSLAYFAPSIPNPTPDNGIFLIEIVIFLYLCRVILLSRINPTISFRYVVVVFLTCYALISIKLSSLGFVSGVFLVLAYWYFSRARREDKVMIYRPCLIFSGFVACHIARGYLLSGVPFFPNSFAAAWDLPWAVSQEVLRYESALIYSWARLPGGLVPDEVLSSWDWIPIWWSKIPDIAAWTFYLATLCSMFVLYIFIKKDKNKRHLNLVMYLPLILGLVFWFFTAPDIRFLGACLPLYLMLSIKLVSLHSAQESWCLPKFLYKKLPSASLARASIVLLCVFLLLKVVGTQPSLNGWPDLSKPKLSSVAIQPKFYTYTPSDGNQCWDSPLPCTPYNVSGLSYRDFVTTHMFTMKPH